MIIDLKTLTHSTRSFEFSLEKDWWHSDRDNDQVLGLDTPLNVKIEVYKAGDRYLLEGRIFGGLQAVCDRCLESYHLDIRTTFWGFAYFPTDWDSYRIIYSAHLRLIDRQSAKVIAEEFCEYTPEYSEDAPSHDDLVESNASGLKRELHKAADYCIKCFKDKTFQM